MTNNKKSEIKTMFMFAGNYHWMTIVACVLAGISTILSMIPFVCIWYVIRDYMQALQIGKISQATNCGKYAWSAFVFSALSILVYFAALVLSHFAAFRTAANMKKKAMHHILTLPLGYFNQNTTGQLRKIIDDNAGLTEGFLAHQLPDMVGALVMPVTILILLFSFDWKMGLCCLLPIGISVICLKQMMGGDKADFMSNYMKALETMNKEAVEYVRGIPVVKVFQQTVYSFKNLHAAIEEYTKYASGYALTCRIPLTVFTVTLNGTFVLLVPLALFLLLGVTGNSNQTEILLDFLFYSMFTPVCTTMLNRIMFASEQLMSAKAAVARIDEILKEKSLKEPESPQSIKHYSITFDRVTFAYPGSVKDVLQNVSFTVKEGQTVALVGASGSGKSTVASLIPRFYDVKSGSVKIGGVDVRKVASYELMEKVAFVFQNTRLYKGTLLENVTMAKKGASLAEVRKALSEAQCDEIVDRLEQGLDTQVGVGGTYLSGGEAQRVALARAILKDAPVLVLDEATAFADAENESKIQAAIETLAKRKTVLMIAHRLSTIVNADQILVFGDGMILEQGTHKELLNKKGIYCKMWNDYQTSISWKVSRKKQTGKEELA